MLRRIGPGAPELAKGLHGVRALVPGEAAPVAVGGLPQRPPDDAPARLEALAEACGGFGTLLLLDLPTGAPAAERRSYELFAEQVVPHCTGANGRRTASAAWAHENSERFVGAMRSAVEAAAVRGGGEIR